MLRVDRRTLIVGWGIAIGVTACGGLDNLKARAAYDLQCAEPQLTLTELGRATYGVEGCGRRGTYVCRQPVAAPACEDWVLNTDVY
jgi:hypothetical protein